MAFSYKILATAKRKTCMPNVCVRDVRIAFGQMVSVLLSLQPSPFFLGEVKFSFTMYLPFQTDTTGDSKLSGFFTADAARALPLKHGDSLGTRDANRSASTQSSESPTISP